MNIRQVSFRAMHEMGLEKEELIAVGDGYSDILSARGAGIKSVLTTWYGDLGVKRDSDYLAESVNDLRNILIPLMGKQ